MFDEVGQKEEICAPHGARFAFRGRLQDTSDLSVTKKHTTETIKAFYYPPLILPHLWNWSDDSRLHGCRSVGVCACVSKGTFGLVRMTISVALAVV